MAFNTQNIIDPTNNPALVILNNITLPGDVIITTSEEKVIAESKILDGVMVFERLSRKPMEIDLTFTFREVNILLNNSKLQSGKCMLYYRYRTLF